MSQSLVPGSVVLGRVVWTELQTPGAGVLFYAASVAANPFPCVITAVTGSNDEDVSLRVFVTLPQAFVVGTNFELFNARRVSVARGVTVEVPQT